MKSGEVKYFNLGPRLTLIFAVLIALILGGNALLVWQFQIVHRQTKRLIGGTQQVIAVLRLQDSLLSFHQRLDELVHSRDTRRVIAEAEPLRRTLVEQIQQARNTLTHLPSETHIDPSFLPTLDAIEIDLPSQIDAITSLTTSGGWEIVRIRLDNEMEILESQISAVVKSIDQESSVELTNAVASMGDAQQRIFFLIPIMAVSTFLIATFFGWAIMRRIGELRLEEQVRERTRIAGELHDTFLQGVISASMQLHIAVDQLPDDSPARPGFDRILQLMGQVIEGGRSAIRGFYPIEKENEYLERAFVTLSQELGVNERIDFRVISEGQPKSLRPEIQKEAYAIGREAVVNSFRHSGASRIEIQVENSASQLRVIVRDGGCGIDPQMLRFGRDGHWGLSRMRDRAERMGGKLRVLSRSGDGTEVELRVPGKIAFESDSGSSSNRWFAGLHRRRVPRS